MLSVCYTCIPLYLLYFHYKYNKGSAQMQCTRTHHLRWCIQGGNPQTLWNGLIVATLVLILTYAGLSLICFRGQTVITGVKILTQIGTASKKTGSMRWEKRSGVRSQYIWQSYLQEYKPENAGGSFVSHCSSEIVSFSYQTPIKWLIKVQEGEDKYTPFRKCKMNLSKQVKHTFSSNFFMCLIITIQFMQANFNIG